MTAARSLTEVLGGKWYGGYGVAPCPVCQPEKRRDQAGLSLRDRADGAGVLAHCHKFGCAFRDILAAVGSGPGTFINPAPGARRETERGRQIAAAKGAMQAERLWAESLPIAGSPAETYLRGRAITCPLPETLRFAQSCWHATARRFPAMVGAVEGADGFAVHRTYLRGDGSGKAEVEPQKAMLGATAGGAVRLARGPGRLVVAEGIETALSLLCGLLEGPVTVWAALSTSGLRGLRLPSRPGQLTVAPDGDAPGRDAAHVLAARAYMLGWQVALAEPPTGADWNDILTGRAAA